MYSIEQAMQRLALLRASGVEVPLQALERIGPPGSGNVPTSNDAAPAPAVKAQPETAPSPAAPSVAQPERHVGLQLDLDALTRRGFLVPETPRVEVAEQFRIIKRPLLSAIEHSLERGSRRSNLIAVTSAMPAEGKTFFSINLAISMALEVEKKVLLVDADTVRPSLDRCLQIHSGAPGLLDVLEGKSTITDSLLHTSIAKLSVLPAGSPRLNSTELLASAAMRRLAEEFSSRYADRIVIFDASPVLATTQASVLASIVGHVVLVVESARTTSKQVARALGVLEGVKNVGVVLNRCRGRVSDFCFDAY